MTREEDSLFDFAPLAQEYDRWYETPAGRAHDRLQQRDVRAVLPGAARGERLLDVGCGTGHWSRFFLSLGYRVHGVDISGEMIAVARAGVPGCTFAVADACDLPFVDASFEVAASMATLEFIPEPALALGEMARCVTPGGRLLIGTLNRLAPLNRRRLSEHRQPYASGHLFSPGELRALLAPWGRVRIVASSRGEPASRPLPPARPPDRTPASAGKLAGPFLVAEVQR